jgi:hypothetical protein
MVQMVPVFLPTQRVEVEKAGRFYKLPTGELLPSVTNILGVIGKPALLNWYAKVEREMCIEAAANLYEDAPGTPKMSRVAFVTSLQNRLGKTKAAKKELDKAAEIGTQAHALIEWNLRKSLGQEAGPEPRISDKATWAFMAWEDWRRTVNLEPLWIEQTVYNVKHGYAGTLDLVARLDLKDAVRDYGRTVAVIDWKTGKAIYPESALQNAAYAWAYHKMGHSEAVPPGLIVRLPKVDTDPNFETKIVHEIEMPELFESFLAARDLWLWQQKANEKKAPAPQVAAASDPISARRDLLKKQAEMLAREGK